MKTKNLFFFSTTLTAILAIMLTACSNDPTGHYADAPYLDFECNFADAIGCDPANTNKPVFIGLEDHIDANCRAKMSLLNYDELTTKFIYSAWTTTSTNGSILTGLFTHWVNYAQAPVITMLQQTYKVCSFIDLNENGQVDTQEPMGEALLSIGENDFLPISNWSNY